jgi:hypothetical protein
MAEVRKIKLTKEQVNFLDAWSIHLHYKELHYCIVNRAWLQRTEDPLIFYIQMQDEISDQLVQLKKEHEASFEEIEP